MSGIYIVWFALHYTCRDNIVKYYIILNHPIATTINVLNKVFNSRLPYYHEVFSYRWIRLGKEVCSKQMLSKKNMINFFSKQLSVIGYYIFWYMSYYSWKFDTYGCSCLLKLDTIPYHRYLCHKCIRYVVLK